MQDRQTKTIVQVCRGADQIEKAQNGSVKVILLGEGRASCMGEEKKREIL